MSVPADTPGSRWQLLPPGVTELGAADRLTRKEPLELVRIRELESQLTEAGEAVLRHQETARRATQDLVQVRKELEAARAGTSPSASGTDLERIRREHEAKVQELAQQNHSLGQQVERLRQAQGAGGGAAPSDASSIDAEIAEREADRQRVGIEQPFNLGLRNHAWHGRAR